MTRGIGLYVFDGETLAAIDAPEFPHVKMSEPLSSGRKFLFAPGQFAELKDGRVKLISGMPKRSMLYLRGIVDTGTDVLYINSDGVYKLTEDVTAARVWSPPDGEVIGHNRHKFEPVYAPALDGIIFGTFKKSERDSRARQAKISKFHQIGDCETSKPESDDK